MSVEISIGLLVIFGIILLPVYLYILASLIGRPKNLKTALLFIGFPFLIIALFIVAIWVLGAILQAVVPS